MRAIAVVGVGSIGSRHLSALRGIDRVIPIAVSRRPARLRELASEGYQTACSLAAASEMGADLCVIATETARHAEDSIEASRTGFHVLVEKPLGIDAAEARRVCAKAGEAGRHVFVGCTLRFSESLNMFRNMAAEAGRIHSVRVECQSYLPDWRSDRPYLDSYSSGEQGGVLRDLIHEIDYTGWIFGWPSAVHARLINLGRLGIAAEEIADLTWEIAAGPVVSITLDYVTRPPRRSITASGEFGTIEWNGIDSVVRLQLNDAPAKTVSAFESRDHVLRKQDLSFIQASSGVIDSRLATGEDGVRALAICDAARLSSRTRREEKVEYDS